MLKKLLSNNSNNLLKSSNMMILKKLRVLKDRLNSSQPLLRIIFNSLLRVVLLKNIIF